ncbi:MAG TPA: hypothetical protein VL126_11970 [Bacteroidota bacterium]|nr:hypothetical protein [Bacteroidota bacterium]
MTILCRIGIALLAASAAHAQARSSAPPLLKPFAAMSEQRAFHTATLLLDGRVLIAGGFRRDPDGYAEYYSSTAELYNPKTKKFSNTGEMGYRRGGHTATLLTSGLVLIAGGWSDMGVVSSAELYDPAGERFTTIGSMNARRGGCTATLLLDGRVLICGGIDRDVIASAELYDPQTKRFTPTGSMNTARYQHAAIRLAGGAVLVVGGNTRRNAVLSSAEIYDPAKGAFFPVADMEQGRCKEAAVELANGMVLIVGGSDETDWRGKLSIIERYEPSTGTFTRVPDLKRPRYKIPASLAPRLDGTLVISGGDPAIEVLNGQSGESIVVATLDKAYYYSTATALRDGSVLILGGYDDNIRSTDAAWILKQ